MNNIQKTNELLKRQKSILEYIQENEIYFDEEDWLKLQSSQECACKKTEALFCRQSNKLKTTARKRLVQATVSHITRSRIAWDEWQKDLKADGEPTCEFGEVTYERMQDFIETVIYEGDIAEGVEFCKWYYDGLFQNESNTALTRLCNEIRKGCKLYE